MCHFCSQKKQSDLYLNQTCATYHLGKLEGKQMNDCQFARVDSSGVVRELLKRSPTVSAKSCPRKVKKKRAKEKYKRNSGQLLGSNLIDLFATISLSPRSLLLFLHLIKSE